MLVVVHEPVTRERGGGRENDGGPAPASRESRAASIGRESADHGMCIWSPLLAEYMPFAAPVSVPKNCM